MAEIAEQLLEGVQLVPGVDARRDNIRYLDELGFLCLTGRETRLIGFHATESTGTSLLPAITLVQRAPQHRNLDDNAKGVGIVMANCSQLMTREEGRQLGVWLTPPVGRGDIRRLATGHPERPTTMALGVARHLGLIITSKALSVEQALEDAEQRYGNANIATIDPAPRVMLQKRGVEFPVTPMWAVYRHRQRLPLQRIGTVAAA